MNLCSDKTEIIASDIRGENYRISLQMEKQGEKILKLNTGNPATFGFKMPDSIKNALIENLDKTVGYCDVAGMPAAREAIAKYHSSKGITEFQADNIFIGNGVSEIASLICSALLNPDDEVLLPTPCYSLWSNEVLLHNARPVFYKCDENNGWNPDIEHIESLITDKTKAIVIINPNNPTGVLYSKEILLKITDIARKYNIIVLADEIYDRLVFDGKKHISIASLSRDLTVITMNGLSKSHSICGFRSGWMVISGPEERRSKISEAIMKIASIRLSSNAIMQTVIPAALKDSAYTEDMINEGGRLYEQRKAVFEELDKIDELSYVKNDAAFYIFAKIKDGCKIKDDRLFAKKLLKEKKILVVPGSGFDYSTPDHFRIVMLPEADELKQAIRDIGDFVKNYI